MVCPFVITATADANGTISPSGKIAVDAGENQAFTFTPANSFYVVDSLWVDGFYVKDSLTSYTFKNVIADHTIAVTFKLKGFCGGNGTEGSPYEICDADALAFLASYVNTGNGNATQNVYYVMTADVDLSGTWAAGTGWEPIGKWVDFYNYSQAFQGNFDGNGFAVKNMKINRPDTDFIGLFGIVGEANIENLGIKDCDVVGESRVGGLAGAIELCVITNCYTTGSVTAPGYGYVGGLVGVADYSTITNCYSTGTVNGGDGGSVGGLVGISESNSEINRCFSTCDVVSKGSDVGGLVGLLGGGVTGTKLINSYATGNATGDYFVGGLVGQNYYGTISYCYATGNVNSSNRGAGGLVGYHTGNIINCVAANASVTTEPDSDYINRIVGQANSSSVTYNNNYAFSGMTLIANGEEVTRTNDATVNGQDTYINNLFSSDFYTSSYYWNGAAWDWNVWTICEWYGMPRLRWQQNTNCFYRTVITAAGANGAIEPNGHVRVTPGTTQVFNITPADGYEVNKLMWDNVDKKGDIQNDTYSYICTIDDSFSHVLKASFNEQITFIPVTNITGIPTIILVNDPVTLNGIVAPTDATNQTIVWAVKSAGGTNASFAGNIITCTTPGTVTITATIANGETAGDYMQDFVIEVSDVIYIVDNGSQNGVNKFLWTEMSAAINALKEEIGRAHV
jgi:hypothetical protein